MAGCPTGAELRDFLSDHLPGPREGEVMDHLQACAACQQVLEQLTTTTTAPDATIVRTGPPSTAVETVTQPPPTIGQYTLVRTLGAGGMGVVYLAEQPRLKRLVALKVIRHGAHATADEVARFCAEAEAVARLQHPNIVQVHDVGEADGLPYLVLEYISGGSLADFLNGRPQPARAAAQLVETLARAVQAAHANGILHRDLKPGNILLQPADRRTLVPGMPAAEVEADSRIADLREVLPKIADFGLAKCIEGDWENPTRASSLATGEWVGTPSYMAPEQAASPRQPIGPPADVYALGAILYELLTGRPPFLAESAMETVLQVLHNEPVAVRSLQPGVPRDLETICLKCLEKSPRKRYASALELADDLQRFQRGEPIKARPVSTAERLWRWTRRHPVAAGLLASGLLSPVVAFAVLSLLSSRLVRSNALDSAVQQAELLEYANKEYSRNVHRVELEGYPVNRSVPPEPGTVPLAIPATFMHDLGEQLHQHSKTGVKVRQYSDYPFPWRSDGGPRDDFERRALEELRASKGKSTVHEFTEMDGQRVVRYAQARVMQHDCVECHNTHPESPRRNWQEGDVRGVLEIIRPLDKDEARVGEALRWAILLSLVVSGLLVGGGLVVTWMNRRGA